MAIEYDNVLLQKYLEDLTVAVCCKGLINEEDPMNPSILADRLGKMKSHFTPNFHSSSEGPAITTGKAVSAAKQNDGSINSLNDVKLNYSSSEVELNLGTYVTSSVKGKGHLSDKSVRTAAHYNELMNNQNGMKLHCSSSKVEQDLTKNFLPTLKGKRHPVNTASGD